MRIVERVDGALRRRGFGPGPVLLVARALILLTGFLAAAGTLLLPLTSWPFWLAAGTALSAWNFYSLASSLRRFFPETASPPVPPGKILRGQLFRSQLRLFITGILLYAFLNVFQANPVALLAGLSAAILVIVVMVLFKTPFP